MYKKNKIRIDILFIENGYYMDFVIYKLYVYKYIK